jgi:hypothetical protein
MALFLPYIDRHQGDPHAEGDGFTLGSCRLSAAVPSLELLKQGRSKGLVETEAPCANVA